ncbi:serine/threonine protein kinase [Sulfodiicoccus acidiphilus]|uniref:Serine/threonine protein kinase n=1 Tax=Sulfodiicoccus acidiphilus TaxID=1670455 RepID=A0A348B336_9CREN|nr:serine/threonine protein kinase [Sulfodiicoccus acidiphilus]GGT93485.1 serine/threonine protein kinase [Sulfodiicoccus acidiphilus]
MAPLRDFIFPHPYSEAEKELQEAGLAHLLSFGKVKLGGVNVIGKGKSGVVALTEDLNVVKIRRSDSPKRCLKFEARMQERAIGVAPRVLNYGCHFILMEYIKGRELMRTEGIDVIIQVLRAGFSLDQLEIEHREITRPWGNVLIGDKRAFIIDFEDARPSPSPTNFVRLFSAFRRSLLNASLHNKYI